MDHQENNSLKDNRTMTSSKFKFHSNIRNIFLLLYIIWVSCSIFLAANHPNKYAVLFADLPTQLKNMPPFILSFVYLVFFVPAVALTIFFILWVVLYLILKIFE